MSRVTIKWVEESVFPYLVDVAQSAGVDTAGWTFGRLFGLSPSFAVRESEGSGFRRSTTFGTAREAELYMLGMIRVYADMIEAKREVEK